MLSMIDREIQTIERLQAITDKFGDISNLFLTLITCGSRALLPPPESPRASRPPLIAPVSPCALALPPHQPLPPLGTHAGTP